jgi:hypothetical protein
MKKPEQKWIGVTEIDVGTELGHPSYVEWSDERIKSLEKTIDLFIKKFHSYNEEENFDDFKEYIEKYIDLLKGVMDGLR